MFNLPESFDRDLVFEFFWGFSVFESALKQAGFLRAGSTVAVADWDAFAQQVTGRFERVAAPGFRRAVEQLNRLAPHRQVVRDGRLAWDPMIRRPLESDEAFTLRLLRTARNNLFHGGKFPDGPIAEIARDSEILTAAKAVLEGCAELHPSVRSRIQEAA